MKKALLAVLVLAGFCFSQDVGTISNDTILASRTVVIPAQFNCQAYERNYTGDSLAKFGDKFIVKFWAKRAGSTIAFDSNFVVVQPKTRGLDTLNKRAGYTWRIRFELLPR